MLDSNLADRFSTAETNAVLTCATLLDPRFKAAGFSNSTYANEAKSMVARMVEERKEQARLNPDTQPPPVEELASGEATRKKPKVDFLVDVLQKDVESRVVSGTLSKPVADELEKFLDLPHLFIKGDIFQYWHSLKPKYPNLYPIAMKYLIVPATSIPSERVFSVSGNIGTSRRTCLTGEHIGMLVFLQDNTDN